MSTVKVRADLKEIDGLIGCILYKIAHFFGEISTETNVQSGPCVRSCMVMSHTAGPHALTRRSVQDF